MIVCVSHSIHHGLAASYGEAVLGWVAL